MQYFTKTLLIFPAMKSHSPDSPTSSAAPDVIEFIIIIITFTQYTMCTNDEYLHAALGDLLTLKALPLNGCLSQALLREKDSSETTK